MPFSIRPFRRFPVHCAVTYIAGPFQGQGTIWNLSCTGWRLSGDLPMRPGETISLTVTLPNEQRIEIPEAVVRGSYGLFHIPLCRGATLTNPTPMISGEGVRPS